MISRNCGVDVCSPGELLLTRQAGFHESEITYTGTSVSDEDIACLKRHPGVRVNCDAISTLRRLGAQCPGRSVGIRINPRQGAGYHAGLHYAGSKATKFGIYQDRFLEALEVAGNYSLNIQNLAAYYQTPFIVAPLKWKPDAPKEKITLAGNINEAIDILAEDVELPAVSEGDYLALLNTGGYGSASSSNHCMRGRFSEYLLIDEHLDDSEMEFV